MGIKVINLRELMEELRDLPGCGNPDCPVHGGNDETDAENDLFNEAMVNALDSAEALKFATAATAGAHNCIVLGRDDAARTRQRQAQLWIWVHERLADREGSEQAELEPIDVSGNTEDPVR